MGIWTYEATIYTGIETGKITEKGLVIAKDFVDAMKRLDKYFGKELMGVRVDWCICDEDNVMDLGFYKENLEKLTDFIEGKE